MELNSNVHRLAEFLKKHGDSVLNGSCKLSLTTSCLAELSRAFAMFSTEYPESDSFRVVPCNSNSGILPDLVFLHDILQKTSQLKLVTSPCTIEGEIPLSQFRSLQYLELYRVPPHLVKNLGVTASEIKILAAHRCLTSVQPLLNLSGGLPWLKLETLRLSLNALKTFGGPDHFKSVPHLKNLDLSHNQILELDLSGLESLICLDLSFNFISRVPNVHRRSSFLYLSHLSLRNNLLENLQGLETLTALKVLDLGHNMVSEFGVLEPLVNLLQMDELTLEGNPISLHQDYRTGVAAHIAKSVILDGKFDVHSDRMVIITMTQNLEEFNALRTFEEAGSLGNSKSSIRTAKTRQPIIGDPSSKDRDNAILSRSLEAASLHKEVEERRKRGGDSWLVQAAADLMLPTAQSTPYEPRTRSDGRKLTRKESRQSDDCIVVRDDNGSTKSIETLTVDVDDVETQPRGAVMTNSQTESAGDLLEDEELGQPVLAGESDKEESPTSDVQIRVVDITTESQFLSALDKEASVASTICSEKPPGNILERSGSGSDTDSSSVAYRVEQDASVWLKLRDHRRETVDYDSEHSIGTESKMHLELVVFQKDENFEAGFAAHITLGRNSFDGFVVLSNKRLFLTGKHAKTDGIHWTVKLSNLTKATVQLGSQSIIVETRDQQLDVKWVLLYIGDSSWCGQLAQQLNLRMPENAMLGRSEVTQADLLSSIIVNDISLKCYCQGYWSILSELGETPVQKSYISMAVATEDVVVVQEAHIEPEKVLFKQVHKQSIMALSSISVDERNLCLANITFTDEASNKDQVWFFETASVGSLLVFIEALRQPWQDIFDVELPLSFIPSECF